MFPEIEIACYAWTLKPCDISINGKFDWQINRYYSALSNEKWINGKLLILYQKSQFTVKYITIIYNVFIVTFASCNIQTDTQTNINFISAWH